MTVHRLLALIALLGGVLAAASGTPYRAQRLGALELAQWIHARKPGLRIVDLRGEAVFDEYHVPRSERISHVPSPRPGETLVVIDDGHVARSLRGRDVYYLRGGVSGWLADVMSPLQPSELTRYFGGIPRSGNGTATPTVRTIRRRGC